MSPAVSVSRPVAICTGLLFAVLLYTSATTLFGTRKPWSLPQPAGNPQLAEQVKVLRERVHTLERMLNAELVAPAPSGASPLPVKRTPVADDPRIVALAADAAVSKKATASTPTPPKALSALSSSSTVSSSSSSSSSSSTSLSVRQRLKPQAGVVPSPSYWSDREVKRAGSDRWCPEPPPYASLKPLLSAVPLPSTQLPTSEMLRLTKPLVQKHASADNMIIVTYVNAHRLDFAYTLVKHLISLGNPHYLIGALDAEAYRGLQSHGIPTFLIDSGLTTKDYGWGTYAFRQLGLHKVNLVYELAATGVDALTVDADAFLLRDPFPYLRKLPDADVLMSSDHLRSTNGYDDSGLEAAGGFGSAFNIGYIFIRGRAVEFVRKWRQTCFERKNDWDQVLFAQVLRQGSAHKPLNEHRLKKMYLTSNGTNLLAGVLPVSLFASGHTFFVSRMAHLMQQHPYMVHTTFQYAGAQGKRHRLRESMIWEDTEEYYAGDKFLVYEQDLPYALVYPTPDAPPRRDGTVPYRSRMSVAQHFALVHHQLRQLRDAFALAKKLKRILILPKLACGLDRWWAPHDGIIPGSAARLPLLECPADHVLGDFFPPTHPFLPYVAPHFFPHISHF